MNSFVDRNGSAAGKGLEQGYLLTGSKENGKKTKKGKMKGKMLANEAEKGFNYSTPWNSDDTGLFTVFFFTYSDIDRCYFFPYCCT